jgi:hypothetical protein
LRLSELWPGELRKQRLISMQAKVNRATFATGAPIEFGVAGVKFVIPASRTGTIDGMNAAIVVLLILLATGVVVAPLLRLRAWLKNSPTAQEFQPPSPDDESE